MTIKKPCGIIYVDYKSTQGKRGDKMTDTKKFEIALIDRGKTKTDIAKLLSVSLQTIYNKINNVVDFKGKEIAAIAEYLKLSNKERDAIFFATSVD